MAISSFVGRFLFASVFLLSAYQEFNEYGIDGGPMAKVIRPKIDVFTHRLHSHVGFQLPEIETKHVVAAAIVLKGIGGVLFICGSSLGAYLFLLHQMISTPILYNFYDYDSEEKEFTQLFIRFTQNLALFGALLFFIGMKISIPRKHKKKVSKTKNCLERIWLISLFVYENLLNSLSGFSVGVVLIFFFFLCLLGKLF